MARRKQFFAEVELDDSIPAEERPVAQLAAAMTAAMARTTMDTPIDRIVPNPFQARREFVDLEDLAESMRRQGFTSRLRVRRHPELADHYQLVYGERRLRAARLAGIARIPVDLVEHTDDEMIEVGLAENIQRRDLTPFEEAQALRLLMDRHGYSQREVAARIGKSHGYVQHRIDLLRAPLDVQEMIIARPDAIQAAEVLMRVDDPTLRKAIATDVVEGRLTNEGVRQRAANTPPRTTMEAAMPQPRPMVSAPEPTAAAMILTRAPNRMVSVVASWSNAVRRVTPEEARAFAAYLNEDLIPALAALAFEADERASGMT
jgi:ParB family chromosome partitioning protein